MMGGCDGRRYDMLTRPLHIEGAPTFVLAVRQLANRTYNPRHFRRKKVLNSVAEKRIKARLSRSLAKRKINQSRWPLLAFCCSSFSSFSFPSSRLVSSRFLLRSCARLLARLADRAILGERADRTSTANQARAQGYISRGKPCLGCFFKRNTHNFFFPPFASLHLQPPTVTTMQERPRPRLLLSPSHHHRQTWAKLIH